MAHARKNPLAWMPLYFRDLRTSETWRLMTHTQRGLYVELMGHQWEEESIPGEPAVVAVLVSPVADPADLEQVLAQFPVCPDGRRRNSRTAAEREGQLAKYQRRVDRMNAARSASAQTSGVISGQTSGLLSGVGSGCPSSASASVVRGDGVVKEREGIVKGNQLPAEVEAAAGPYLRPSRFPEAIRATLANLLNPEASPNYPAAAVVTALTEMQAAGRPFNASTLTAWLSRSRANTPTPTGGMMAKMRRAI